MLVNAISIRQPYAGLIVAGIKMIENRGWKTARFGTLAICATKKPEPPEVFDEMRLKCKKLRVPFPEELCAINGACIGTVEMVGIVYSDHGLARSDQHKQIAWLPLNVARRWWDESCFGWVMRKAKAITPFPVSGKQGLFTLNIN